MEIPLLPRHASSVAAPTDPHLFGPVLKRLRESRHLSQRDLSTTAGLHVTYVGKIEGGAVGAPTKNTVEALAAALRATEDELEELLHASGHLPPGHKLADRKRMSFEVFVAGDPDLTKDQRDALIASYRAYVRMNRGRPS